MARNHARVMTAIWADPQFVALEPEAQRMYLLLLSQPDLTPCGALPHLPRRWARLSARTSVEEIENALSLLEDGGYVLIDRDTDELVIRTLVVHDGGLGNPNHRGAVKSALKALHSPRLRQAVIDVIPEGHRDAIADGWTMPSECHRNAIAEPSLMNAEVGGRRQSPVSSCSVVEDSRAASRPAPFEDEFQAWYDGYPRHIDRKDALTQYRARRRQGETIETLTRARDNYAESVAGVAKEFIKYPSTFLAKDGPYLEYRWGIPPDARRNGIDPLGGAKRALEQMR